MIEVRDDPRKGLYPGLHQYRAVCHNCGWKSRWFNYQENAHGAIAAHVGLSVVSNHCSPLGEDNR